MWTGRLHARTSAMLGRRLILLAIAATALALPAPASAIVNGDAVAEGDYPAHGFLGIDSDGNGQINSICSGTLVGSRQFLTAARCTTNPLGYPAVARPLNRAHRRHRAARRHRGRERRRQ